ncbi:MAG: hypothetical protein ACOYMR_13915, partial [Ilumatobacteraceae bacterium]
KPAVTTTTKPPVTTTTAPPARKWQFVPPVLAYNSVLVGRRLPAGQPVPVSIASLPGVDPSTTGVLVRVVARNITAAGSLSLHACGSASAPASLSFSADHVAAAVVTVPASKGSFCVTASTSVDVRIAVIGQRRVSGVSSVAAASHTVLDDLRVVAGRTVSLSPAVLGQAAGSAGVSLKVTLRAPTSAGSVGIGACGGTPWIVAFPAAPTQTYTLVVPNGSSSLCVTSSVDANVTVAVTGHWMP